MPVCRYISRRLPLIQAGQGEDWTCINDTDVHQVLLRSGIERTDFGEDGGREWFNTDLETAKCAIAAAKQKRTSLLPQEISIAQSPIVFRPEQKEAIERTCKRFGKSNRMLWNAKMRFGKTLSALEVIRRMGYCRTIILTHRPVVNAGWYDDFQKIFRFETTRYDYGSKEKGNHLADMENACRLGNLHYVYFASMQDLRGSEQVGGKFDKNHRVFNINWDCIIVDEAHEGTQTQLGQNVLEALTKPTTKVLQLSGTPFNLFNQYKEDEIYTWDYVMEQRAKTQWDETHFGDPNPYSGLPTMNIYTFDLGRLMAKYMDMDVAFNFTEFFRTRDNGTFVHEQDVRAFLDLLTKPDKESLFPFSNEEFRRCFHHTLFEHIAVFFAQPVDGGRGLYTEDSLHITACRRVECPRQHHYCCPFRHAHASGEFAAGEGDGVVAAANGFLYEFECITFFGIVIALACYVHYPAKVRR